MDTRLGVLLWSQATSWSDFESAAKRVDSLGYDLSVRLLASGGLALAMTARRECGFDVFCRPPDRLDRPT